MSQNTLITLQRLNGIFHLKAFTDLAWRVRSGATIGTLLRTTPIAFLLFIGLSLQAQAETLLVGGTGSADPIVRALFKEFSAQAPDIRFEMVSPALGSSGAIKALSAKRIHMAVISRLPKNGEASGREHHFNLGETPFVLVTNGGKRQKGFTDDELASVYHGQLNTWDDGTSIRLVLRTDDEADTMLLRSISENMDKAITTSTKRIGMVYGKNDLDTSRTPGSLGPSNLGLLATTESPLTPLPINGVKPSVETLKDGRYPWRKKLVVVLPNDANMAATRFADFLRSSKANALLLRYGYLPANS